MNFGSMLPLPKPMFAIVPLYFFFLASPTPQAAPSFLVPISINFISSFLSRWEDHQHLLPPLDFQQLTITILHLLSSVEAPPTSPLLLVRHLQHHRLLHLRMVAVAATEIDHHHLYFFSRVLLMLLLPRLCFNLSSLLLLLTLPLFAVAASALFVVVCCYCFCTFLQLLWRSLLREPVAKLCCSALPFFSRLILFRFAATLVVVVSVAVLLMMINCSLLAQKQHHSSSGCNVLAAGFVVAAVVEVVVVVSLSPSSPCRELFRFQVRVLPLVVLGY